MDECRRTVDRSGGHGPVFDRDEGLNRTAAAARAAPGRTRVRHVTACGAPATPVLPTHDTAGRGAGNSPIRTHRRRRRRARYGRPPTWAERLASSFGRHDWLLEAANGSRRGAL